MQKFWKSGKIWQSYREFKGGKFFLRHSVYAYHFVLQFRIQNWTGPFNHSTYMTTCIPEKNKKLGYHKETMRYPAVFLEMLRIKV